MKIIVNGELKQMNDQVSILKLLQIEEVKMPEMVTVEVNGEIIDREEFEEFIIKENDAIEFIYFMGGGTYGL